ncbi:MAG: hypothetical protein CL474_06260 [Acidobacteria bacterium]|nr:hypothetical protein [Acidobacteriota bacterium]
MWVRINRGPLYSKAILNRLKWRKRLGVEPSPPAEQGATDFEDREGHRAPFASRDAQAGYARCIRIEATLKTLGAGGAKRTGSCGNGNSD